MKQKLNLTELKVKSFVTDLTIRENKTLKEMKGGTIILVTPLCTVTCTIVETILEFTDKCTETCDESNGRLGCSQIGTC